ncbi:restriction endonuclease subunit S [Photobacterium leiognathi]|uniref:restriction endonuclease subunit S n=1 Tax=Photobacterium leiognathi TaxID=553611 RepID=UPI002982A754|nr:restriction endonuclease subunit S [Photobacterium leiognathi]
MTSKFEYIELSSLISEKPRNGLYKKKEFQGKGHRWIKMGEVYGNDFLLAQQTELLDVTASEISRFNCQAGDLLFGRTSLTLDGIGDCLLVGDVDDVPIFESNLFRVRFDASKAYPLFYFYFFKSAIGKRLIQTIAKQTAATSITSTDFVSLSVPYAPLDRQKEIGDFLFLFDKKCEFNTQTTQTLEEMAQAIFKSWFVDFDPVKAKMNGKQPEGMDAATASLFPEKLIESELGLIPEGWDISPLSKYINIKHGFAFKGAYFSDQETDDICVTPGNFHIGGGIKLNKLKYYDGPIPEDYIFSKGDLMVTMTDLSKKADTLGYPAFVPESEGKTYLHNQRIGKVELKVEQDIKNYLYSFFCSSGYRNEVLSGVTGSTVKHTAPKKIMAIELAIDLRIAEKFSLLVSPLFEKQAQNMIENSQLEKLRDTLLPKLLSGEIELEGAGVVEENDVVNRLLKQMDFGVKFRPRQESIPEGSFGYIRLSGTFGSDGGTFVSIPKAVQALTKITSADGIYGEIAGNAMTENVLSGTVEIVTNNIIPLGVLNKICTAVFGKKTPIKSRNAVLLTSIHQAKNKTLDGIMNEQAKRFAFLEQSTMDEQEFGESLRYLESIGVVKCEGQHIALLDTIVQH